MGSKSNHTLPVKSEQDEPKWFEKAFLFLRNNLHSGPKTCPSLWATGPSWKAHDCSGSQCQCRGNRCVSAIWTDVLGEYSHWRSLCKRPQQWQTNPWVRHNSGTHAPAVAVLTWRLPYETDYLSDTHESWRRANKILELCTKYEMSRLTLWLDKRKSSQCGASSLQTVFVNKPSLF